MQQHPIPQNVTQYQFRLVGDMTLKQFLELAGGLLLAYLFFASNLIFIFKWPLIILSVLFGVGLAFFPIEDRPLDQWIINFVRAIYGPTRFIWKKSDKIPSMFTFKAHTLPPSTTITKTIKAPAAPSRDESVSDLSELEAKQINSISSIFSALPTPAQVPGTHTEEIVTRPSITVRKLKPKADAGAVAPIRPAPKPAVPAPTPTSTLSAPKIDPVIFSKPSVPATPTVAVPSAPLKTIKLPSAPKSPNLVVGVVVDNEGKLLENSIVELVSADGIPQRAMKTNALGQFYTATPLTNGVYTIEVENAGHTFKAQQINISGTIIPPFELRATS